MPARPLDILGRVAFWALFPTIVLAVTAQLAAAYAADVVAALGVSSLIIGTFVFILLGSMLINTLLILRTPATLRSRSLDPLTAIPALVLAILMVVTNVLLAIGAFDVVFYVLPIPSIIASIVVCVGAVRRRRGDIGEARTAVPIRTSTWVAAIGAIVISLALVAASPFLDIWAETYELLGSIDTPWQWALFLLGLPWSYVAQVATSVIVVPATISNYMVTVYGHPTPTTIVFGVTTLINVAVTILLLVNGKFRVWAFNWFFRLGRRKNEPAD